MNLEHALESPSQNKNYYEVLEVPMEASPDDIHRGYLRAKNAYSQDSIALYSLMTKEECEQILDLIEEAYTILSDPNKRQQYDEARGFNQGLSRSQRFVSNQPVTPEPQEHHIRQNADSTNKHSMTKIVAKKRFGLDYDVNADFEKEIEQTSEFTGEFLRRIREYKQVDLPRLADMTKISKTYLKNIEEEDIDKLPAEAYTRGFVFQYAKCLKLNPDLVATSYLYRIKKLRAAKQ
jgi:curved DNA-binding protein CbpA